MKRFTIRLDDDDHAALLAAAVSNRRSLHAEILTRLQASDSADEIDRLKARRSALAAEMQRITDRIGELLEKAKE